MRYYLLVVLAIVLLLLKVIYFCYTFLLSRRCALLPENLITLKCRYLHSFKNEKLHPGTSRKSTQNNIGRGRFKIEPPAVLGTCVHAKSLQSYLILCNPMNSSVHGILQTRILEWVARPFFRGSSWTRDWTHILLCLLHCRWVLYN